MADIPCPKCAETWDLDTIHEVAAETDSTFKGVLHAFQREGCKVLGGRCTTSPQSELRQSYAGALYELLGDDVDGIANEWEDLEAMGL